MTGRSPANSTRIRRAAANTSWLLPAKMSSSRPAWPSTSAQRPERRAFPVGLARPISACAAPSNSARNARARRDLPIPGSPMTVAWRAPRPAATSSNNVRSRSSSPARPISRASSRRGIAVADGSTVRVGTPQRFGVSQSPPAARASSPRRHARRERASRPRAESLLAPPPVRAICRPGPHPRLQNRGPRPCRSRRQHLC